MINKWLATRLCKINLCANFSFKVCSRLGEWAKECVSHIQFFYETSSSLQKVGQLQNRCVAETEEMVLSGAVCPNLDQGGKTLPSHIHYTLSKS